MHLLRKNRRGHAWLSPAFLLVVATTAGAQTTEESAQVDEAPLTVQREEVVVESSLPYLPTSNTISTKLPVELFWTPANVGVVERVVLEEQNAWVLGDGLRNVSGLNVQTGNGVFDFFVLRGFDSLSSGLVLTDGAPEPEVTFYQLYNAESIEVLKGPAGFLYGSNPLAGAVNIVRKQPVPANLGAVGLSYGSFGTSEATLDVNRSGNDGKLNFRLNGLWRESDGHRDGLDSEVVAINPALTWRPSERTTLNINLEHVTSDFLPDAGQPLDTLDTIPRERSFASPFDFSEQGIDRLQIDYESRLSERLTLRNKSYYRRLDWQTNGTLILGAFPTPFGPVAGRSLVLLDDDQQYLGNQFEVLTTVETGRVTHNLLAGLEIAQLTDEFRLDVALLPVIAIENPIETAMPPLFLIPGQSSIGDATSNIVAPYLIDQITLSDKVRLTAGVRFDEIDFDDDATGTSRSDGELSPMLGIVYSPAPGFALYANAAESFAPPSARVAGERKPEESTQLEAGVRKEWRQGDIRSTFAVFEIERENIAIPDDNGFTQQAGDQRSRGLELDLAAELGSGLRALLAYSYTDSELTRFSEAVFIPPTQLIVFDRSGNTSAFAPEHLVNLWLSKRLPNQLTIAGGLRYVDDQFIAEDNLGQIDSYLLLDAAIAYSLGDWRLTLNLKNLLDEEYETRGFGSAAVIPGAEAAAFFGVEYRF